MTTNRSSPGTSAEELADSCFSMAHPSEGASYPSVLAAIERALAIGVAQQPPSPAISAIHDALAAANIEYAAYSCNGVNLVGDGASVKAALNAFHSHGQIDHLKTQIRHWREECGKLHARAPQPSPRLEREGIRGATKVYIDSALHWQPVFEDGRGGNDLSLDATLELLLDRHADVILALLSPDTTVVLSTSRGEV